MGRLSASGWFGHISPERPSPGVRVMDDDFGLPGLRCVHVPESFCDLIGFEETLFVEVFAQALSDFGRA